MLPSAPPGTEMMQNLQLYRGKKGMDTMFDHNEAGHLVLCLALQRSRLEELMHQLRLFLEIHELWRQIDPDSPAASRPESFSALTVLPAVLSRGRVLEGYREIPNDYPREQMTDQQKCIAFELFSRAQQLKVALFFLQVLQLCWHPGPASLLRKRSSDVHSL